MTQKNKPGKGKIELNDIPDAFITIFAGKIAWLVMEKIKNKE